MPQGSNQLQFPGSVHFFLHHRLKPCTVNKVRTCEIILHTAGAVLPESNQPPLQTSREVRYQKIPTGSPSLPLDLGWGKVNEGTLFSVKYWQPLGEPFCSSPPPPRSPSWAHLARQPGDQLQLPPLRATSPARGTFHSRPHFQHPESHRTLFFLNCCCC